MRGRVSVACLRLAVARPVHTLNDPQHAQCELSFEMTALRGAASLS